MAFNVCKCIPLKVLVCWLIAGNYVLAQDITERVDHRYAENDGVRIHYAVLGSGPLIVMVHGFPDYWYTWRHQMEVLAEDYTVAAGTWVSKDKDPLRGLCLHPSIAGLLITRSSRKLHLCRCQISVIWGVVETFVSTPYNGSH